MNLTLRQLRALVAVAGRGGFARAAEYLHVSPSALSMSIRQLEEELGVRLFDRNTRLVRLTEGGREFVVIAEKALGDLESAVARSRDLAKLKRGRVTIAASIVLAATLLPWAIRKFTEIHPGIRCVVKDSFEEEIRARVLAGEVDFGVGTGLDLHPELTEMVLFADRLAALLGHGHPLAAKRAVTWRELSGYPVIALTPASPSRALADRAFSEAGIRIDPAYEASFSSTVISMVAAGLGVAALPVNARQLSPKVRIHVRPLSRPVASRRVCVFSRRDAAPTPAAEAFLAHLKRYVEAGGSPPALPADQA